MRRLLFKNKGEEIIKRNIKDLIQFKEVLKEVEGSNTENRLLIIFNFFLWWVLLSWRLLRLKVLGQKNRIFFLELGLEE